MNDYDGVQNLDSGKIFFKKNPKLLTFMCFFIYALLIITMIVIIFRTINRLKTFRSVKTQ